VTVTELGDDTATMVMDATRARFRAPVGDQSTVTGAKRSIGGPPQLLDTSPAHEQPTGPHNQTR
jgi:hypothetical protein